MIDNEMHWFSISVESVMVLALCLMEISIKILASGDREALAITQP